MGHILANGYTTQRCGPVFHIYKGTKFITTAIRLKAAKQYAETH